MVVFWGGGKRPTVPDAAAVGSRLRPKGAWTM